MIDSYSEYSKINPLYGGSLPLNLKEVLHHAGLTYFSEGSYRTSSFGYTTLEQFLIKTNYPKEVVRDIKIAVQDKDLLDLKVSDVFYKDGYLHFHLIESNMDCTKIYLSRDSNKVKIRYLSYIEMGGHQWGSYQTQS